ncbi:MAG TPA: HlyD family efflux transporter periplasmic adaptor subunit [Rhodothermia bacterium]|nr:HlyD family efflux transporter periplasmic adaptor subunit [Rhodothermia bacterium]
MMNHSAIQSQSIEPISRTWRPSSAYSRFSALAIAVLLAGCGSDDRVSDAYGNFEATEVLISSEAAGRIMVFDVEEGSELGAGQTIGHVDTVQLALQRDQLIANRAALHSRIDGVLTQIHVLDEQRRVATVELDRIRRLMEARAATQKQLDDIEGQISVIDRQILSTRSQNATIRREIDAVDAQIRQIEDRIRRSIIVNPVPGTVLVKVAEAYEQIGVGSPLYKIADLSSMYLRAYVSGDQLPALSLGQNVTVLVDKNRSENQSLEGQVSWIASDAEFTPKTIQTKEERVDLVYAFKVRVPNPDGLIKIGMPGEVRF